MKNFAFIPNWGNVLKFMLTFCLALVAFTLMAQSDEPIIVIDYSARYSALVGAITMTWGYIAESIGLKKQVPKFVFVVIAGAVVIIGIFLALGFGDGISHVIAVLTSMGIFDLLKGATKKT